MKNRRAYPVQIVQVLHCISEKTTNTDLELGMVELCDYARA